jgi:hypothetical protein
VAAVSNYVLAAGQILQGSGTVTGSAAAVAGSRVLAGGDGTAGT